MTPNDIWSILGIVVILGGVLGFVLTASLRRTISQTQEKAIESLRGRVDDLEGEKTACAEKNQQLEKRVESLERENDLLKNMVSGTSAVERLALQVSDYHDNLAKELKDLKSIVRAKS